MIDALSWLLVAIVQVAELGWLVALTAALIASRHRQDRLVSRVANLSKTLTKVSRIRHTASQAAVDAAALRLADALPLPPPPFPVPPPSTNPMTTATTVGRHAGP